MNNRVTTNTRHTYDSLTTAYIFQGLKLIK